MHDVDLHLRRIGVSPAEVALDLAGLSTLQRAHLAHVPFENLDIVFSSGVAHDIDAAFAKIVGPDAASSRGGWCFEVNGLFARLLDALGFRVTLLGAAVLLDGPSTILEHLTLEVSTDGLEPHLVDVGFGDSFTQPLALNSAEIQPGGPADFQLIASPQGTTLAEIVDGVPAARYRFKRVGHRFDDFAPVAASMQVDPDKHWRSKPFATRLLDRSNDDRVTLTHDRLKLRRGGTTDEQPVARGEWHATLDDWFRIELDHRALPET